MDPGSIPDSRIFRGVSTASALDTTGEAKKACGNASAHLRLEPKWLRCVRCRARSPTVDKATRDSDVGGSSLRGLPAQALPPRGDCLHPDSAAASGLAFPPVARVTGFQFPDSRFHGVLRGQSSRARVTSTTSAEGCAVSVFSSSPTARLAQSAEREDLTKRWSRVRAPRWVFARLPGHLALAFALASNSRRFARS
jgi:hypothetical protein